MFLSGRLSVLGSYRLSWWRIQANEMYALKEWKLSKEGFRKRWDVSCLISLLKQNLFEKMHCALLEDTTRSLKGNASYSKSNLSSRGGLNLKKHKCGWHACHRSAEIIHSYCKSHHWHFHIWKRKPCYACKTRGSFPSHIGRLRRMNSQLQRPTLKCQRPNSEV